MESEKINVLKTNIMVRGKVFHTDGRIRINLKRPIRDMFEPVKEDHQILYIMEMTLSKERLMARVQELTKEEIIPILFYFIKKKRRSLSSQSPFQEVNDVSE